LEAPTAIDVLSILITGNAGQCAGGNGIAPGATQRASSFALAGRVIARQPQQAVFPGEPLGHRLRSRIRCAAAGLPRAALIRIPTRDGHRFVSEG
jgi:hypothetical protein